MATRIQDPGRPGLHPAAVAALLGLAAVCAAWPPRRALAEGLSQDGLVRAVTESHRALLEVPGGVRFTYHLSVDQHPRVGGFAWESGEGEVAVLWPRLYNKFKGRDKRARMDSEREGEYNFESKLGAGREGRFVQVTPYRQVWSSIHLFPLRFLCLDEAEQLYSLGKVLKTDYWLPSALRQNPYEYAGKAEDDGVGCEVYRRPDGTDALWLAPARGYVLCRRERREKGGGNLTEVIRNTKLKNIAPGVWLPTVLVQEQYSSDPAGPKRDMTKPICTLRVELRNVSVGKVKPGELHVTIPKGAEVDDTILGVRYHKTGLGIQDLETGIKNGRYEITHPVPVEHSRTGRLLLGAVFGSLSLATVVCGCQKLGLGGSGRPRG